MIVAKSDWRDEQAMRVRFRKEGMRQTSQEFAAVLATEMAAIDARREKRDGARQDRRRVGLALSGGGIRSSAVSIGTIQALNAHGRFNGIDYLSSVSGGGYAAACLSASMCKKGAHAYPFGGDVKDSLVLAHIRNYSNYLLPRSRSAIRNWCEGIAILLRGFVANAICILAFLLPAVLITLSARSKGPVSPERMASPTAWTTRCWTRAGLTLLSHIPVAFRQSSRGCWHYC